MHLLLKKINWQGFNKRVLSDTDLQLICDRANFKIHLIEFRAKQPGWLASNRTQRFLFLSTRFVGWRRLEIAFHELGHAYAHGVNRRIRQRNYHAGGLPLIHGDEPTPEEPSGWLRPHDAKDEFEADAVAMISLIPKRDAEALAEGRGLPDDHPLMIEHQRLMMDEPGPDRDARLEMLRIKVEFRLHILRTFSE